MLSLKVTWAPEAQGQVVSQAETKTKAPLPTPCTVRDWGPWFPGLPLPRSRWRAGLG